MADKLRIAVLGIDHPHGMGWRESLTHVRDELEITALMPAFDNATASLEERLAKLPRFDTVDELLNEGGELFDAALVCLPNDKGPDAVIQLAQAGKHILLEKPGAGNAADARRMAEAVREAKVAFQNGFMWRYDELTNRLRDMVRDGRFGRLISVEMTYATSNVDRRGPEHYLFDEAQSGGGFFNWLACHHLDLVSLVVAIEEVQEPHLERQHQLVDVVQRRAHRRTQQSVQFGTARIGNLERRALDDRGHIERRDQPFIAQQLD